MMLLSWTLSIKVGHRKIRVPAELTGRNQVPAHPYLGQNKEQFFKDEVRSGLD